MAQPVVRDARKSDARAISDVSLHAAVAHVTHSDDKVRYSDYLVSTLGPEAVADELEDGKTQFLLAEREGRVVGVIARKVRVLAHSDSHVSTSHIRHFYVEEPGQGVGRCLWEELRWRMLADQVECVTVNSTAFAKRVYEKLGFRPSGGEEEHGGLTFQPMELELGGEQAPLPVLIGPRVILRAYRMEDAAPLQRLADNANLARRLPPVFPHPFTLQDAEFWVRFTRDKNIWAVTLQNEVIGNVRVITQDMRGWGLDDPSGCGGELRYWLGEKYWRQGYGTEMLDLLLVRLRCTVPSWTTSYRLVARVPEDNAAGRRVLEKLGFQVYRRVKRAHKPHPVCKRRGLQDCVDLLLVVA